MTTKKIFQKFHLLLGLVSGLIVFIVSITGALYAFKDEIESVTQTYREVEVKETTQILPSEAFAIARKAIPDTEIHGVTYEGSNRAIEVIFFQRSPFFYGAAYVNPYSGEVLHTTNFMQSFFGLVLMGHTSLWLPRPIGQPIISVMVIVYFILLITGIVLWWPNKKQRKGAFSFKKSKNKIVKIRELHTVFGFYASFFVLILLLTGSIWLFKSVEKGIYSAFGGTQEIEFSYPESDWKNKTNYTTVAHPLDSIYHITRAEFGTEAAIEIHDVTSDKSTILVEVNRDPSTYWQMDYLFYDQYSLQEIAPKHIYNRFDEAGLPEKVRRLNLDLHDGSIGGFLGKLLAFLVSLLSASFPVTGFLFWWLKRKKKKENKAKKVTAEVTAEVVN